MIEEDANEAAVGVPAPEEPAEPKSGKVLKFPLWRLFVALPLPETSKRELLGGIRGLSSRVNLIPSREPYLHVTLAFLGNVAEPRVVELITRIKESCEGTGSFRLRAEGLGTFGRNVLWVGLRGSGEPRLRELAIRVRAATRRFAERPDERPFSPHITLARRGEWPNASRFAGPEFARLLQEHERTVFTQWRVDRVVLYRSELQPKGAMYTPLAEFPLSGSSSSRQTRRGRD